MNISRVKRSLIAATTFSFLFAICLPALARAGTAEEKALATARASEGDARARQTAADLARGAADAAARAHAADVAAPDAAAAARAKDDAAARARAAAVANGTSDGSATSPTKAH